MAQFSLTPGGESALGLTPALLDAIKPPPDVATTDSLGYFAQTWLERKRRDRRSLGAAGFTEKPESGFPPRRSWPRDMLLDAQGSVVTSRRIPERGFGLLGHLDLNYERHFAYRVPGNQEDFVEDLADIILAGKVMTAPLEARALVKISGRHCLARILNMTDRGCSLVALPLTNPTKYAWLAPPWRNELGVWTDRPYRFSSGPIIRLQTIALQAIWLPPKTFFSYHDILDIDRQSPVLVEPVLYYELDGAGDEDDHR